MQKKRRKELLLLRYTHMATANPEWAARNPNLAKELINKSVANKVETKKYIDKETAIKFKYGEIPKPSIIIKRYNRVV